MTNPTPAVNCKYGAPMGRRSDNLSGLIVEPYDPPFTLRRIRLTDGGCYDSGGAYWGSGQPLYWWAITITEGETTDECSGFMRACGRGNAKAQIRALHPHARFYR